MLCYKYWQFNCKIIFVSDVISNESNQPGAYSSSISAHSTAKGKRTEEHKNVISDGNVDLLITLLNIFIHYFFFK